MRLAIIGLAHPHISTLFDEVGRWDDLELVAVADPNPELVSQYTEGRVARRFTSHLDLLNELAVDIVAVGSVYGARSSVVIDALAAGAHVLVDKPLCTTLDQLVLVERAAADADRIVSVIFEKRFYPVTLAVRELVESGELGTLVQVASSAPHKLLRASRPEWFFRRETYGGVLGDLASHDVDLTLLFSQARFGSIIGKSSNISVPEHPEFKDYGTAFMMAGAVAGSLEVNWLTPDASRYHGDYRMRLTGTEGTAELFFARGYVEIDTAARGNVTLKPHEGLRPAEDAMGSLLRGAVPEVNTAASIAATRIALLAQRSADNGGVWEPWQLD